LQGNDGRSIQQLSAPSPESVNVFRKALNDNGLIALFRPPLLHCCPPLVITEEQLRDGFQRLSAALDTLDAVQKSYLTDDIHDSPLKGTCVRQGPPSGDAVFRHDGEEEPLSPPLHFPRLGDNIGQNAQLRAYSTTTKR
jgi:hypothetical protein